MKPYLFRSAAMLLTILIASLNSCKKADDALAPTTCKLTRAVYTSTYPSGSSVNEYLYSYDADGRFTGHMFQYVSTPKTGSEATGSAKRTLVYDATGFVVSESTITENTQYGQSGVSSVNTTYDYANGRLVKKSERAIQITGAVTTYSTSYAYDGNGKIAQITNAAQTLTFTNGLLTKFVVHDGGNGTDTQPATINSQGLITKRVFNTTSYNTYEYDAQQQLMREENWTNNKLRSYHLTEYDDKKLADESANPSFKGQPAPLIFYGSYVHNDTRHTIYRLGNDGQMKKESDAAYTYTYNAKGYPLGHADTDIVAGPGSFNNVTYTYADCN